VVADEVRNLATKSASAADDTNELIADTMNKSEMGSNIVKDTSEYLNKIMNGVSESTWILKNIAAATAEQNESIEVIKGGFGQLTNVVHQNSATAEQSAAATEEMSSQTDVLLELVGKFKVGEGAEYREPHIPHMTTLPVAEIPSVASSDSTAVTPSTETQHAGTVTAAKLMTTEGSRETDYATATLYGDLEKWRDDESKY
jgi:methyl-accepting chemotaxis protein